MMGVSVTTEYECSRQYTPGFETWQQRAHKEYDAVKVQLIGNHLLDINRDNSLHGPLKTDIVLVILWMSSSREEPSCMCLGR